MDDTHDIEHVSPHTVENEMLVERFGDKQESHASDLGMIVSGGFSDPGMFRQQTHRRLHRIRETRRQFYTAFLRIIFSLSSDVGE